MNETRDKKAIISTFNLPRQLTGQVLVQDKQLMYRCCCPLDVLVYYIRKSLANRRKAV